jgi:hypothetical protein
MRATEVKKGQLERRAGHEVRCITHRDYLYANGTMFYHGWLCFKAHMKPTVSMQVFTQQAPLFNMVDCASGYAQSHCTVAQKTVPMFGHFGKTDLG